MITWQFASIAFFVLGIGIWILLIIRSWRETAHVDQQWGRQASRSWRWGKLKVWLGVVGMFISLQQLFPLSSPWKEFGFFAAWYLGLIWGEWNVGTGFKHLADVTKTWRHVLDREPRDH